MTSRLAQMQARFQQKQMQEKEEKLLKLYENQQQRAFERVSRGSAGSNTSTTSIGSTGGGKVRQMFDERRQKAGIDKSYPLEPLKAKTTERNRNTTTSRTTVVKATAVKKTVSQVRNGKSVINQREVQKKVYDNHDKNENYEEHTRITQSYDDIDGHTNLVEMMNKNNLHDELDNETLPQIGFNDNQQEKSLYMSGKLSNVGGKLPSEKLECKPETNRISQRNDVIKHETKVAAKKPTVKAPPRSSSSVSSASSQSSRNSPARSENNINMSSRQNMSSNQPGRAPSNNRPSSKQVAKSPVVRDDLAECRYCGRRFATDRVGTHEDICGKTGKKKRKIFDATKHRVQGTELESYVLKPGKKGATGSKPRKAADLTSRSKKEIKVSSKQSSSKGNWRKTHEEFIAAIRAAKQAQAYVAKGGNLADLPPPPPSSNPDYVQCPHCGRRFNESAAERHIPKCASYSFNKPKNGGGVQKGRPGKR